jgi:amino acid adenylation domain-containing protein
MSDELLSELHRRGIRLRLRDGQLDVVAPAGTLTAQLREALSARRGDLIELLQRDGSGTPLSVTADPAHRYDPFPLTDIQHAYWVGRHTGVELGGVSCHWYLELDGEGLDLDRLEASLRRVIDRHDMLRAVVDADGRQRVLPQVAPYEIARADLRGLDPETRGAALAATYDDMGHHVLPADRWPLFDIRVSRTSERGTRLHVSLDVLILDGLSLNLLFRDWRRFYQDPDADLGTPAVAYRDFVVAEDAARAGAGYAAAERYWLGRLESLPPAPRLPLAITPSQVARPLFRRRRGTLPAPLWQAVKREARDRGLTPSVVLLTAYADVLGRWSDQTELTLNLTLFNRPEQPADLAEVIGDFTSVSLLAVVREPGDTFAARAARVQRQFLRDLEHTSYSGVRVLRERAHRLGDGLGAAMPVVFTSALVSANDETSADSDFFGRYAGGISQTPQVWLDHQVTEQNGSLLFHWDSVDELFPDGVLDDMFASYSELLQRLARARGDWQHDELVPTLPNWQARQRQGVNATAAPIPARTLGDLVEYQVAARPDAPAVIAADRSLTYAALAAEANRLANHLDSRGDVRGTLVAVVLDKGWEQVAAALGVVRCTAAYLPIDPSWPAARRDHLLARGRVAVAVSTPALRDALAWPDGVTVVTFDDPAVRAASAGLPAVRPDPTDLAYTIFTSGSTGEPKGVMIDHRGAANTVRDINERFGVTPVDRVLALSSLTFDLSVYDIFGTLAAGATIVMPHPDGAHDPAHWTDLVRRHGVTVWNSVPALAKTWTENTSEPVAPTTLRLVLLSGDWIPVRLPDAIRAAWPGAEVISLGGATEASIWSICYPIGTVPPGWVRIPYGMPLANQTVHVYDHALRDCPTWTVGEIHIGGTGVALGYWADPARTAERFVRHPDSRERLYRTGDLGRYLPDGNIEFLGRADFQVKINGYRIELGEIEAALRRLPGVEDAVAHVDTHPGTGRRQLVAYVVPAGGAGAGGRTDPAPVLSAGTDTLADAAAAERDDLAAFEDWWVRVERVCPMIMARTLARLGVFTAGEDTATAESIVAHTGLQPRRTGLVRDWLRVLADSDLLTADGDGTYRCRDSLDAEALDREITAVLDAIRVDGVHRVFLDYFRSCADRQIELLDGRTSPLELLLPGGGNRVTDALYATNPAARVNNRAVAGLVRAAAAQRPVRILEVGAGTGATAAAVLPGLPADRVSYLFTDVSTFFTDRARARFADFAFVEYGRLDIDVDPAAQGVPGGSVDMVIAANVLHDARDVDRTLRHLRATLAAGGLLVLIEGTTNSLIQALTVGFLEGFGQHATRDLPLLSTGEWGSALRAAGFEPLAVLPDGPPVTAAMPQHVIVAVAPGDGHTVDPAALRAGLEAELPEYLVPQQYVLIDRVPLSPNGKVDRGALPAPWHTVEPVTPVAPTDDTEAALHAIWADALGHADFGVEDNFFELGGDSLHAIRILTRVREDFGLDLTADDGLQMLFDSPTISQLAKALDKRIDQ